MTTPQEKISELYTALKEAGHRSPKAKAAELLGYSSRNMRRWMDGTRQMPKSAMILIEHLMKDLPKA